MNFKRLQDHYLPQFETELKKSIDFNVSDDRKILKNAIQYAVESPGKRIRPLICMMTEKSLTNTINISMPISVAVELLHCYSLIHDDLPAMDNDDFRRGKPTCHKAYGDDIAILAGDILNSYAFEYLITELKNKINDRTTLDVLKTFATSCGIYGMAGGQALDLKANHNETSTLEQVQTIHQLKTGQLFNACFLLVAKATQQPQEIMDCLTEISHHFGLLFQIIDDILDETGKLETIGKSPGKDSEKNKLTYVSLFGLDTARKKAIEHQNKGIELIKKLPYPSNEIEVIFKYICSKGQINVEHHT